MAIGQVLKDVTFEGNKTTGFWFAASDFGAEFRPGLQQLNDWVKNHTFADTWYTLDEYNTKFGTNYSVG